MMENDDKEKTFENQSSAYDFKSFTALASLNFLLSLTATFGNILILLALRKETLLHPPSRLLLRCLAITDLCVGLTTQPLAVLHSISILTEHLPIYKFTIVSTYITSATLSGVSLFVLTSISVDRLLALSLGIRYRQTVTTTRVRGFVIFFWAVNITNGIVLLISQSKFVFYIVSATGIFLCMVISTFCYAKIYLSLRLQQMKVLAIGSQEQTNGNSSINFARYKNTVSSALWVHLTLLACYLPYSVVSAIKATTGDTLPVIEGFTASLIFFNSSLNPVLYCWRIREVRQAAKETIRQYCTFLSSVI